MIRVQNVTKRFGDFAALHGIDLEVRPGEVVALVSSAIRFCSVRGPVGVIDDERCQSEADWKAGGTQSVSHTGALVLSTTTASIGFPASRNT